MKKKKMEDFLPRAMVYVDELVTRKEAARIYGATAAALDYLVRRGHLLPVFVMGHTRLFLRHEVMALKSLNLHPGRPRSENKSA